MFVTEGRGFLGCRRGKAYPWVVENTPKLSKRKSQPTLESHQQVKGYDGQEGSAQKYVEVDMVGGAFQVA